jgi:hypothetical protein
MSPMAATPTLGAGRIVTFDAAVVLKRASRPVISMAQRPSLRLPRPVLEADRTIQACRSGLHENKYGATCG